MTTPSFPPITQAKHLKWLDRVRVGRRILIVVGVNPRARSNYWIGVLESGQGTEYVFGLKHCPVKIGEVSEDHPALKIAQQKKASSPEDPSSVKGLIFDQILTAVENNDLAAAKEYVRTYRTLERIR